DLIIRARRLECGVYDALTKNYIDAHTATHCGHFSENLVWRSDFEESFCPECSREFDEGMAKAMLDD
ncbi:hypothetical protein, partial [Vibrio paracholerae]|uniref:hypothetical protein n=1 Tax=Vibrio paracholerae TaxID=650003 RepID=UPI001C318153